MTTITDTLYRADGSKHQGHLKISWPSFYNFGADLIQAGTLNAAVADGVLSVTLEPNDTATPAGLAYRVEYHLDGEEPRLEYWSVPTSTPAVKINDVRDPGMPGPYGASFWKTGAGSPNGSVTGRPGDLYTSTAGGASTTLYVKESGVGTTTGWVPK